VGVSEKSTENIIPVKLLARENAFIAFLGRHYSDFPLNKRARAETRSRSFGIGIPCYSRLLLFPFVNNSNH
jgi:hypothetical protein